MSPTLADYFGQGGESVDDLVVNAYLASRFGSPPQQGSPPPDLNPPDATTLTTTNEGGPGAFQLALPSNDLYWVSVNVAGILYWKLYNAALLTDPGGALAIGTLNLGDSSTLYSGSGAPSDGLGVDGDFYFDNADTSASELYKKVTGSWAAISGGGGGGGLLGYGVFQASGSSSNFAQWTAVSDPLSMLGIDTETFTPPAGSVNIVLMTSEADAVLGTSGGSIFGLTTTGGLIGVTPQEFVEGAAGHNPLSGLFANLNLPLVFFDLVDAAIHATFKVNTDITAVTFPSNSGMVIISFAPGGGGGGGGVSSFNTRTGDVTLEEADVESVFGAEGDLLVGTGAGTGELLAKGSAGEVLTIGGSDPSGLEWAAPAVQPGQVIGSSVLAPSVAQISAPTNSTTLQAIPNASVTFDAPASGDVLVRLTGWAQSIAAGIYNWGLLKVGGGQEGGTCPMTQGDAANGHAFSVVISVTGLTPGDSYTFDWAHSTDGSAITGRFIAQGKQAANNSGGPAVMEVLAQ